MSDNNILIGEPNDSVGVLAYGAAHLYDSSGNFIRTYLNPAGTHNDEFGWSVSVTDTHVLIGAHNDESQSVTFSGQVYLYDHSGNLLHTFENPTPLTNDKFGHSVSIDGNNIVIGAPGTRFANNDAGTAYLYDSSGTLLQTFPSPTSELDGEFGNSVSLRGFHSAQF